MDPFVGQIMPWPMNWAPQDWVICDGSTLSISQYQALYSLLGTQFGGDGRTTFGVPDLRGRVPVGMGTLQYPNGGGSGQKYQLANVSGYEAYNLKISNLPAHGHTTPAITATVSTKLDGTAVNVNTNVSTSVYYDPNALATDLSDIPGNGKSIAQGQDASGESVKIYTSNKANTNLAAQAYSGTGTLTGSVPTTLSIAAGNTGVIGLNPPAPIDNRQPCVVLNYIIAVNGIYPMRP